MAQTVNFVTASKPKTAGALYHAPLETTLPTDATTALNEAFIGLGYISEDGVSQSEEIESENIKAWGGDIVLTPQTGKTFTYTTTLIEALNPEVQKVVHGSANVSGDLTNGLVVKGNATELPSECYVIETIMRNDVLKRTVIPNGKITSLGEVLLKDSEAVGYEVTITASPDSKGNSYYDYYIASASVEKQNADEADAYKEVAEDEE